MSRNENVWEYYGKNDPYFGVISTDDMRSESFDESAREAFFAGGEAHVARVWKEIEDNFETGFAPANSLDFGCGVGRVALPIARRSGHVTGIDISEGMLDEARRNAARLEIENATFVLGDDGLSRVTGRFQFIHSFIVFQHIKPDVGMRIAQRLIDMLDDNGIGALHFQYLESGLSAAERIRFGLYRDVPGVHALRNLVRGGRKEPLMAMYAYDLNKLMQMLQKSGCHKCLVRFSDHGVEGAMIVFRKKVEKLY